MEMLSAPSQLRVLHIVDSLETGGLERMVHDLVVARIASGNCGATSVACLECVGVFGEALRARGISVQLTGKRGGFLAALWRMRQLLRRVRPDVIHCHNLDPLLIGGFAARLTGAIPVVMTKHGNRIPRAGPAMSLIRWLIRSARVVAVSLEALRLITEWMPRGCPAVLYIANGIATEAYDNLPPREVARSALGFPAAAFIVGTVSRLVSCKRHLDLLEAFAEILPQFPGALLAIVGDGPLRPEIEARIARLGLQQSVVMLGDRRDIPEILAALDVFCLPSDQEGMPMTVLEAMAAGLPVVASDVGGIPELVDPGVTGLIVPAGAPRQLAAALSSLARDPALARAMGSAGGVKLRRSFSISTALGAYEECYREIKNRKSKIKSQK
jgi:glycosyltransferase involved in cell wall biosynthesis